MEEWKSNIDPFNEEDWDEVDYETLKKFGYYFDHNHRNIMIEKYNDDHKKMYFGEISNLSDIFKELTTKVNDDVISKYRISSDNLLFYLKLKTEIKSRFGILKTKGMFGQTIHLLFMNPFKKYFVTQNLTGLNYTITSKKSKPKFKDYGVRYNGTTNIIKSHFNIFNSRKATKEMMKIYKELLQNSINNQEKIKNEIESIFLKKPYTFKYI